MSDAPMRRPLAVLKSGSPVPPRRRHGADCAACPNAERCALRRALVSTERSRPATARPERTRAA